MDPLEYGREVRRLELKLAQLERDVKVTRELIASYERQALEVSQVSLFA